MAALPLSVVAWTNCMTRSLFPFLRSLVASLCLSSCDAIIYYSSISSLWSFNSQLFNKSFNSRSITLAPICHHCNLVYLGFTLRVGHCAHISPPIRVRLRNYVNWYELVVSASREGEKKKMRFSSRALTHSFRFTFCALIVLVCRQLVFLSVQQRPTNVHWYFVSQS